MTSQPVKIHIFGHSFVKRLRDFIGRSAIARYDLGLQDRLLIQYSGVSGATAEWLRDNRDDVTDFDPNIVILCVGTNDIYDDKHPPATTADNIVNLVETLLSTTQAFKVVVMSITHRCTPTRTSRYPVNIDKYNARVDELNVLLSSRLKAIEHNQIRLWRLKGFWSPDAKLKMFGPDGCHLSDAGQMKLMSNIRAAVVAVLKGSI